ncbi:hypothetical protein DPMN_037806 [Dreissena polymorpha]|uniref:Uncharacterized protein n=1 Tax=Dreissena polymorpha TaxID=45954 RepID=A0A9D4RQ48_DREPO|nr:hypothetical protein DPMN_037806 [Dreissena polymorpha]
MYDNSVSMTSVIWKDYNLLAATYFGIEVRCNLYVYTITVDDRWFVRDLRRLRCVAIAALAVLEQGGPNSCSFNNRGQVRNLVVGRLE